MQKINAQIKAAANGTAPMTVQASAQLTEDLAVVERSLNASGADASVVKQFSES